jgi:hypothetical protein
MGTRCCRCCCCCCRDDRRVLHQKYAGTAMANEIRVPEQCPDLWSAIQRSIGSSSHAPAGTVIRLAEGTWDLGERPPLLIDCDGIRIVGSGIDMTRLVRFDQMPKLQISGGATNVVLESLSVGGESTGDGIAVLGSAILKLVNVEVTNNGGIGLHVSGGGTVHATKCQVRHNACTGVLVDGPHSACVLLDAEVEAFGTADGVVAMNGGFVELLGKTHISRGDGSSNNSSGVGLLAEGRGEIGSGGRIEIRTTSDLSSCERKKVNGGNIVVSEPPTRREVARRKFLPVAGEAGGGRDGGWRGRGKKYHLRSNYDWPSAHGGW